MKRILNSEFRKRSFFFLKSVIVLIFFIVGITAKSQGQSNSYTLEFDGVNDYVQLSQVLSIGNTSNTVEAWVKIPEIGNDNLQSGERVGIVLGNYDDNPNTGWEIHDDGQMRLYWNSEEINAFGTTDLRDNEWHHIAFVRDKTEDAIFMYVDGVMENLNYQSGSGSGSDIVYSTTHRIGADNRPSGTPFFHGEIDELRVWDVARSQAEIQASMNSSLASPTTENNLVAYYTFDDINGTTLPDNSINSNDGTLNFTPIDSNPTDPLNFDGIDDYVEANNVSATVSNSTALTMEAWIYPENTTNQRFILTFHQNSYENRILFGIKDGVLALGYHNSGDFTKYGTIQIAQNTWTHIAFSLDDTGNAIAYINGQEEFTYAIPVWPDSNGRFSIGQDFDPPIDGTEITDVFDGDIDEVRVWSTVRSQLQIQQNMATELSGNENNLLAYYAFDDISGITLPDNTTNGNDGTLKNFVPEVTTQAVTNITAYSATGNGNISNLGTPNPTQYGVCWSTVTNPTIDDPNDGKTEEGTKSTTGAFTSSITGLTAGTTYYLRAYATNSGGTSYGDVVTFTTLTEPVAVTPAGSGTSDDPYQIATLENLYWLNVNSTTLYNKHFVQVADIDASATATWDDGKGWAPIGHQVGGTGYFYGQYDGQSHTISGLTINRPGLWQTGFFGFIGYTARISNLGLIDVDIAGGYGTGALVGQGSSDIEISNCFSTGNVKSDKGQLGGLIGGSRGYITNCYSSCEVSGNNVNSVGGFIGGYTISKSTQFIKNCYASGNVTGSSRVGGFIGELEVRTSGGQILDCYATGDVRGGYSGGFGGYCSENKLSTDIVRCYSIGKKEFFGYCKVTLESNSFWDINTDGVVANLSGTTKYGAVGKTTTEMKTQSTFTDVGWDFSSIWKIDPAYNSGYPYFQWQILPVNAELSTINITSSTNSTANSGGNITADNGFPVLKRGVVWSTTERPTIDDYDGKTVDGSDTGSFISNLTGLEEGSTYYVRAYATNSAVTNYGNEVSFTTNNTPTASNFTASPGPYQNVVYTFLTSEFGYTDSDSDPLDHVRITAVSGSDTLYVDADNDDTYDAGEELSVNDQVSKTDLDAGNLQFYTKGTISTSFTFDVNDGTDYSSTTYTATLNIIPAVKVSITAQTNVACNGGHNGSLTATVTPGAPNYNYVWTNGSTTSNTSSTTNTISSLTAGTYSVTVTDLAGNTDVASATITQPASLLAVAVADSMVSCNGLSDGGATASATGGTGPYAYLWSNSATTASITGVSAGNYSVTITDNNGCTDVASITITEPASLVASVVADSMVSCNGSSDGGATASATGGTGTYTYLWSNSATTASITGVPAGTYSVTITDNNGCSDVASVTITEPTLLEVTASVDSSANSRTSSDGGATGSASGGTTPYTYSWSNGSTTASITGVSAGTYGVTVTDGNGCTANAFVDITVDDDIEPVVQANPIDIILQNNGIYVLASSDINRLSEGTTDNNSTYEELEITATPRNFECIHTGDAVPVKITAEDAFGNIAFAWTTVTVHDTISPVANCKDVELVLDENGEATLLPEMVNSGDNEEMPHWWGQTFNDSGIGSYDACGIESVSIDRESFDCSDVGSVNIVKLTVSDFNGNVSTCTAEVTIIDSTPPVFEAVDDITIELSAGDCETEIAYPEITGFDNCSNFSLEQIEGFGANGSFPVGSTTEIWKATDENGNTAEISFLVTVNVSNSVPTIDPIEDVKVSENSGSVRIPLSGISYGNDCEEQEITLTAWDSDSDLISAVVVNYFDGNSSGSLELEIAPDKTGYSEITVLVEDAEGGAVSEIFNLTVNAEIHPPYLVKPLPDQFVTALQLLKIPVSSKPGSIFDDDVDTELSFEFAQKDGSALPAWMTLNGDTLECLPALTDTGCVDIVISATDPAGATATDTFSVFVEGLPLYSEGLSATSFSTNMYPNPTKGNVVIELGSQPLHDELELTVLNVAGGEVLRKTYYKTNRILFDISDYVSGVYIVILKSGERKIEKKLILDK